MATGPPALRFTSRSFDAGPCHDRGSKSRPGFGRAYNHAIAHGVIASDEVRLVHSRRARLGTGLLPAGVMTGRTRGQEHGLATASRRRGTEPALGRACG